MRTKRMSRCACCCCHHLQGNACAFRVAHAPWSRPHPLLYTKAFVAHALAVMRTVPCERLLLMDIVGGGGGYRELGAFLRVTPPNEPFPDLKPPPTTDKVRVFDVL